MKDGEYSTLIASTVRELNGTEILEEWQISLNINFDWKYKNLEVLLKKPQWS